MHAILDPLRKLHDLNSKILQKKGLREAFPESLRRRDAEIEQKASQLKHAEEKLAKTRSNSERLDLEIKSCDESIKKLEGQMAQANSNREYDTFLKEIASKKADLSNLEDQALEALNSVDELVEVVRAEKQKLDKAKKDREREAANVEKQTKELDHEIEALEQQRPTLAEKIDDELLDQYNRIVTKRRDTALVPVVNNTCQGCFMKVTPEAFNTLNRGTEVLTCKSCGRILYLP